MSTIRTHKTERYSVIDNEPINDNSLSWGARGILVYLLSKPDNWQIRAIDLIKQGKEGKSAVYARLTELENAGYLHREQIRDNKGRISWVSHIYEIPDYNPHFQPVTENREMDKPVTDFPELDNPDTDNRTVISTEQANTDQPNTMSFTNVKDAPPNKTNDLNDLFDNRDLIIAGLEQEIAELKSLVPPNGKAKPIKAESKNELSPPPIKPKTIIKDRFCELANRKMPESKSGQRYWWGQFGIMLIEAGGDYERACWALGEVVPYMRANNLHIKDPHSVMGLFGEVLDGHKLNGKTNGSPKTDIAPGQAEKWSNLF